MGGVREEKRREEKRKIKKIKEEKVRRKKIRVREKVGESRETLCLYSDLWLRRVEK